MRRTFTDTGDGGADGPRVRLDPTPEGRLEVVVTLDDGPVTMRRCDVARLHRRLGAWLHGGAP